MKLAVEVLLDIPKSLCTHLHIIALCILKVSLNMQVEASLQKHHRMQEAIALLRNFLRSMVHASLVSSESSALLHVGNIVVCMRMGSSPSDITASSKCVILETTALGIFLW